MFRVSGWIATAALTVVMAVPAHADEASKRAKIEEMFTLMHMQQTLNQLADQQAAQMKKVMPALIQGQAVGAEEQKSIDAFTDRLSVMVRESISWENEKPQFLDLYAKTYDETTIDGMVAFYRSPAGQTMVAKQPELIAQSQMIAQTRLQALQPKMRAAIAEFMGQMGAKDGAPKQ
ncbi:MAG: DUF2059 domain-containing protein [Terriglobus sp.]